MIERLKALRAKFLENLETIKDENLLENFKKDYLWKNWKLSEILKWLKDLSNEEKKEVWPTANELKNFIIEQIDKRIVFLEDKRFDALLKEADILVCMQTGVDEIIEYIRLHPDKFIFEWYYYED